LLTALLSDWNFRSVQKSLLRGEVSKQALRGYFKAGAGRLGDDEDTGQLLQSGCSCHEQGVREIAWMGEIAGEE